MTKRELEKKMLEAAMKYIRSERAYNDYEGNSASEHMIQEDDMYCAKEEMEDLYDELMKLEEEE